MSIESKLTVANIFHLISAIFSSLIILIGVGLCGLSVWMLSNDLPPLGNKTDDPIDADIIAAIIMASAFVYLFIGVFKTLTAAFSAYAISKRRYHSACCIAAAITCTSIPFGTLLGGFTLYLLLSEEGKRLFNVAPRPRRRTGHHQQ